MFYTKKGDTGVSHISGKQIRKSDEIFMLLGALDECNCWLGLVRSSLDDESGGVLRKQMLLLQEMLFIAQAEVASIGFGLGSRNDSVATPRITANHVTECENMIHIIDESLPKLTKFILPGASKISSQLDIARTVARKAERYAIKATDTYPMRAELLSYLNRLSSVLFALARAYNHSQGFAELHPTY